MAIAPIFNTDPLAQQAGLAGQPAGLPGADLFIVLNAMDGGDYGLDSDRDRTTQFLRSSAPLCNSFCVLW